MYEDSCVARLVFSCKMFKRKRSPNTQRLFMGEIYGRTFLKNCHSSNSTCLLAEGLDKHPINRGLVSSYLNTEYGANTCESKSTKFPHSTREAWILSTTVFKLQGDRAPSDRHELESLFVSFAAIWLAAGSEYSRRDNSFISMPGRPAH